MRRTLWSAALLTFALAAPLVAQGGRGDGALMMSGTALAGPVSADTLRQVTNVAEALLATYRERRERYMQLTAADRDTVRARFGEIRAARQSGDRSAMRRHAEHLRELAPSLRKRDREFEDRELKTLLTEDQYKAFKKWRDARDKAADEERARMREQYGGRRRGR